MDNTVTSYVPIFYQAHAELRTIRDNYHSTFELTEPRIFNFVSTALETVWHGAASGLLSSRYSELFTCDGRIKQVRALFESLDQQIINRTINFHLINSPANLDALLVSHLAFGSISRFIAFEGVFAFPTYNPAKVEILIADSKAASELLLETYKILRDE